MFPFPWKILFRFFSAMMLLFTGGFAAHDFTSPPPPPPVTAPAPSSTTTTTAPAATGGSTTTTTAPSDSTPPVVVTAVPDPVPTTSTTVTTKPAKPTTTTTTAPAPVPAPAAGDTPPGVPVPGNAPSVCAAAATPVCGPAAPVQAPDHAAAVQACQDWWNSLAAAFTANNRPDWAAQATQIAGQCDAMITRWEQLQQQWAQHHPDFKGDHNADGHPDNGKGPQGNQAGNGGDHPTPPPPPAPGPQGKVSRHGEGPQH